MRARSIIGARAWLVIGGCLLACRATPASTAPAEPTSEAPLAEPLEPLEPTPCGPLGERFEDHAWIPAAATTTVSLQLDAPDLHPALQALGEHVRAPGHGLPIPLAFSLGQWSWQVPVLVATLAQAGLHPAELVFLRDDAHDHAWVWRSTCDLDETLARIETAWSVRSRRVVQGMIAAPRATDVFPYDVLMLPGERMALVPAGRASAALAFLTRPPQGPGLGGAAAPSAGHRLDGLELAPVRLVFLGQALLDPATTTADPATQTLRITGDGVQGPPDRAGDASLRPAP